jgi:hypothetical protein
MQVKDSTEWVASYVGIDVWKAWLDVCWPRSSAATRGG